MYEAEIETKTREIAELERRIGALQARLVGLRVEVKTLAAAGHPPERPADRTDRILEILREADEAMSPKDLVAVLDKSEPGVEAGAVRATLNYLKKRGLVVNPQRGRWTASSG